MGAEIALVTGGSKGIGAEIARGLALDGFDIWLNYRTDHSAAQQVQAEIEALGRACLLLPFDVQEPEAVRAALTPLLCENVPVVLVNNAGYTRDTLMMWMQDDDWNDVLSVHLGGFFYVTRCLLEHFLRRRKGRIVNVVSTSGQTGVPGQVNYSAAKAGLIGATRSLAREVARRNILVNAVAPGFIETAMTEELPLERILPMIPLGRLGTPGEVSAAVRFLVSPAAKYITGQVLSVNGGVYMA